MQTPQLPCRLWSGKATGGAALGSHTVRSCDLGSLLPSEQAVLGVPTLTQTSCVSSCRVLASSVGFAWDVHCHQLRGTALLDFSATPICCNSAVTLSQVMMAARAAHEPDGFDRLHHLKQAGGFMSRFLTGRSQGVLCCWQRCCGNIFLSSHIVHLHNTSLTSKCCLQMPLHLRSCEWWMHS